jgi:hypothetical protein
LLKASPDLNRTSVVAPAPADGPTVDVHEFEAAGDGTVRTVSAAGVQAAGRSLRPRHHVSLAAAGKGRASCADNRSGEKNSMTVAAIYARKSTDQSAVADEAKSVTRQVDHARAYAAKKGWRIDERFIFTDDGISGGGVR